MKNKLILLGIFLFGLSVSLFYAFHTKYLTVYDASRDYQIYNQYRLIPIWHSSDGILGLQNTAILSSYVPALIQWITKVPSELFFKLYISFFIACVPAISYLITRMFINKWYAIFSPLFVMGWVAFYQGGSYARLNIAVLIYGVIILIYYTNIKHKYLWLIILSFMLPLAHYGVAIVAIMVYLGSLLWCWIKTYRIVMSNALIVMALLISFVTWQVIINNLAWQYLGALVNDTILIAKQGSNTDVLLRDGQVGTNNPLSIMSRDRITQAALGVSNPDNANVFHLNMPMLIFAWLTVYLMLYGAYVILKGRYSIQYKAMVFLSFMSIGMTVLIPQVSRGYGLEKMYYQTIIVCCPCVIMGADKLSCKLHIPSWFILLVVLIPYVALMWRYGIIPSALG